MTSERFPGTHRLIRNVVVVAFALILLAFLVRTAAF